MKRSPLVLAIAACAALASSSTTSAQLSDLMETTQAPQPNYAQYWFGPYRRHVRRIYRKAYRRAYYGYPYSYSGYYRPYAGLGLIVGSAY